MDKNVLIILCVYLTQADQFFKWLFNVDGSYHAVLFIELT